MSSSSREKHDHVERTQPKLKSCSVNNILLSHGTKSLVDNIKLVSGLSFSQAGRDNRPPPPKKLDICGGKRSSERRGKR